MKNIIGSSCGCKGFSFSSSTARLCSFFGSIAQSSLSQYSCSIRLKFEGLMPCFQSICGLKICRAQIVNIFFEGFHILTKVI